MTSPQEQFNELTRRTQEGFKNLWQQWSEKGSELMKGVTGRAQTTAPAGGNPEEALDAVFDFAENLIAQQRTFAKQMLAVATKAQPTAADTAGGPEVTTQPTAPGAGPTASGSPSTTAPTRTPPPPGTMG